MSDVNELIKRAEDALKDLPPTPWRKEYSKGAWCIVDSNNQSVVYDIDDTPEEIADFIEHSPVLIRELVDALKEAEINLESALMREQKTKEEMESWIDQVVKLEKKMVRTKATPEIKKVTLRGEGVLQHILYLWEVEHVCSAHGALVQSEDGEWHCPACDAEGKR